MWPQYQLPQDRQHHEVERDPSLREERGVTYLDNKKRAIEKKRREKKQRAKADSFLCACESWSLPSELTLSLWGDGLREGRTL